MLADGNLISEKIKNEIKELIKQKGEKSLAIFYVGKNEVIDKYVALKEKFGREVGVMVKIFNFEENIKEEDLTDFIKKNLPNFSGAIIQLPLPPHINKNNILNLIPKEKDVDVLSNDGFSSFSNKENKKLPPVVFAISEIIKYYNFSFANKENLIIGNGQLVGKPVSAWFDSNSIKYKIIDVNTKNSQELIKNSDVIISGAGVPNFINPSMLKEGVSIFDAGASTSSGKIYGDFDKSCYTKASFVTPVPGGIGPVTVACLFKNLFL